LIASVGGNMKIEQNFWFERMCNFSDGPAMFFEERTD
jgi:hypothetical protein